MNIKNLLILEECFKEGMINKDFESFKRNYPTLLKVVLRAMQRATETNTVLAPSGLTPELFCKVHSQMYGETIDKLKQLDGQIFDGEELYELCLAICQAACAKTKGG